MLFVCELGPRADTDMLSGLLHVRVCDGVSPVREAEKTIASAGNIDSSRPKHQMRLTTGDQHTSPNRHAHQCGALPSNFSCSSRFMCLYSCSMRTRSQR